jgi:hypothetical protein
MYDPRGLDGQLASQDPGWCADNPDDGACVGGIYGDGYPCPAGEEFISGPNPCQNSVGPPPQATPKPPQTDCTISLDYHSVAHTPGNHSYLIVTGSLGTWDTEGEPTGNAVLGLLAGYWGTLQGVITQGVNGYNGWDNPSTTTVNKQGVSLDDIGCMDTAALLAGGKTAAFNQASRAPSGGWNYSPVPVCFNQSLGLCTYDANSNSYASFLLYEIGELSFFGQPPNTPGWGRLNPYP